ncbi:MAG: hypothetical protein CVU14_10355 [Bacteroidetes bacterium HGW-Bacteroidetes-9]|jgi:hypothetical protein|nr:MAG: hypothetical protein CVU14_10355 [Bacteroidetes bacterium HGW-Bacteroidetes-9]
MRKNKPLSGNNHKTVQSITPQISATCGSIKGKYPVVLDGGKTTIYIDDKSREAEIIERYNERRKR